MANNATYFDAPNILDHYVERELARQVVGVTTLRQKINLCDLLKILAQLNLTDTLNIISQLEDLIVYEDFSLHIRVIAKKILNMLALDPQKPLSDLMYLLIDDISLLGFSYPELDNILLGMIDIKSTQNTNNVIFEIQKLIVIIESEIKASQPAYLEEGEDLREFMRNHLVYNAMTGEA